MDKRQKDSDRSIASDFNVETEVAVTTLADIRKLAAKQRESAEDVLARARAFEEQVAAENQMIASLIAAAEFAHKAEREAQAEFNRVAETLNAARAKRIEADADVAALRARVELLAGTNGLDADALRRVVERRTADALRIRGADAAS